MDAMNGQRFGRLTVQSGPEKRGKYLFFFCVCDCGVQKWICKQNLTSGRTISCGCFRVEVSRAHCESMEKHGESPKEQQTPEYRSWVSMRRRCNNPKNKRYKDYGGRGIRICAAWSESYLSFLADMGRKPSQRHSIERKENNGNYEPGNCRWALPVEQSNNRRSNRILSINGETHTATQWARLIGVSDNTIFKRLGAGWTEQNTLTVKHRNHSKHERTATN